MQLENIDENKKHERLVAIYPLHENHTREEIKIMLDNGRKELAKSIKRNKDGVKARKC